MLLGTGLLDAGCVPQTDLAAEGGGAGGATSGGTVATASLVDPPAGATDVPLNLAAVWVKFPGPVSVPEGALTIAATATPAAVEVPVAEACPDGTAGACLKMGLTSVLRAGATYVVRLGSGVVDLENHELPGGVVGQFATAPEPDLTAPVIDGLLVQPSGPCVVVTFSTNEPAQATVRVESDGELLRASAGAGAANFRVAVSLAAFAPGAVTAVVAEVQDRAGNRAESAAVSLTVPSYLVPLAITEVHANPAGAEPAQEFVEVRNLGSTPLDLQGLVIADAKGMDTLPATLLAPGAYGLIVASGFDPASAKDTPPRSGTPLVRIDSRIGADGLSNSGESVRLLSARGDVISSYAPAIDVSAASWSGQSVHRVPEEACDQDASWTHRPAAATPGWGAP